MSVCVCGRPGLRPVIVAPPIGGQLQGKGVGVENYPGTSPLTTQLPPSYYPPYLPSYYPPTSILSTQLPPLLLPSYLPSYFPATALARAYAHVSHHTRVESYLGSSLRARIRAYKLTVTWWVRRLREA
eukprot:3934021-Rhodomonas_salina.2